jgi:hypothetical protein
MGAAFRERGADELAATLAARAGIAIFRAALGRWMDGNGDPPLHKAIAETLAAFHDVTADATIGGAPGITTGRSG